MSVPTTANWDESTPAGSSYINTGDERIREMKAQVREIMEIDHDFPSSATATGYHKKVTLQEQADLGTGAINATILGSQTVSGKGELVYTDEDNNDVQITSGGKLKAESISGVYPAANVGTIVNILPFIYPVGCIYTTITSTNPATVFGFGTWVAFGAGRVLVGLDAGQTEFDTVEETGGAKTHTLNSNELPSNSPIAAGSATYQAGTNAYGIVPNSSGGQSHNNLQPYIVVYFFKRTA